MCIARSLVGVFYCDQETLFGFSSLFVLCQPVKTHLSISEDGLRLDFQGDLIKRVSNYREKNEAK
jgi:hypothetical protein